VLLVYATSYSSKHAGQSPSTPAMHGLFPTTNRVSRKHSPLSDNCASLSDSSLSFTLHSVLCTLHYIMELTHLSNTAPPPSVENTRRIWSAATGIGEFGGGVTVFHFRHFHHSHRIHRLRRQQNRTTTPTTRFIFYSALCTLYLFYCVPSPTLLFRCVLGVLAVHSCIVAMQMRKRRRGSSLPYSRRICVNMVAILSLPDVFRPPKTTIWRLSPSYPPTQTAAISHLC
jgi:hypothetical protein